MLEKNPVMVADLSWERDAIMTPCVLELDNDVLRMYSARKWYELDAIGVAHSYTAE